ncbi:MAG TPA: sigma-70 family RNA polymerase sigma factor [Candidatus Dormibacteraeota bacterium]|nr:sigma-70 family RNA polymerase sigma factor [Candidatus Dormibacteraeota bacterium]
MGEDGERSDDALLSAARQGDRPALEALLGRYQARIYRYGLRMCGDPEDAKDVLQETMLAMARRVGALQAAGALPTWLYTVARSFCLKRRRGHGAAPTRSLDDAGASGLQVADPARGPEDRVAGRQLESVLAAAIAELNPAQRDVLILRDVEGLSAPQVAEVLGIGVKAVKSRLHRGRVALRDRLAPALGLPASAPAAAGCPDVLTLWSRHREGEITADLCARMEEHLARCPRCAAACESLKRTLVVCQSAPTPVVPAAVQQALRQELDRLR